MNAHQPNPYAKLWVCGYHKLTPIIPPGAEISPRSSLFKRAAVPENDPRGKVPGIRHEDGSWSSFSWASHPTDERDLARWWAMGAGIGVRTGAQPDGSFLVAIDADTMDPEFAKTIRAEQERRFGPLPVRIGRAPKALSPLRLSAPMAYTNVQFSRAPHEPGAKRDRVEVLAEGRQFVAAGTHPVTMLPYRWTTPLVALDQLPIVSPEDVASFMEWLQATLPNSERLSSSPLDRPPVDQSTLVGRLDVVKAAVNRLPNTSALFGSREAFLDVGYAIKAACGEDEVLGLELYQQWAARWTDGHNDPDEVEAEFNRMKPPFRIGASWLYRIVREATGGACDPRAGEWFEPIDETAAAAVLPDALAGAAGAATGAALIRPTAWVWASPASIRPREFIYGTHYQRGYLGVTIAPTKVGKSSLTIVEALAMASGRALLGVKPRKRARVWLWNGEDPSEELDRRIAASMIHHGLEACDVDGWLFRDSGRQMPIVVARQEKAGAVLNPGVEAAVTKAIRDLAIDVFVIDPGVKVHRVSENDNMAMDLVAACLNRIAGATGCAVETVVHSRKLNGIGETTIEDARGASALISAARSARVLARMSAAQGKAAGRAEDYRLLFRLADAQSNMAPPPRGDDETWFELKDVDLRNAIYDETGAEVLPSDRVGVVALAQVETMEDKREAVVIEADAPDAAPERERALAALKAADYRASHLTGEKWAGHAIGRAFGLDTSTRGGRAQASSILNAWVAAGTLEIVETIDEKRRPRPVVRVAGGAVEDLF